MPLQNRILAPGPTPRTFIGPSGERLTPPPGWSLLAPGDAALTRRVKAMGPTWTVQEKKGRKVFSRGVWAPAEWIESVRAALVVERKDPAHARRKVQDAVRRERVQVAYELSFEESVHTFLAFDARYDDIATTVARLVANHATPVGSGTVARTKRIPIEERAEAAVIAWMRHQTTAYDGMEIPRVKGMRREVRRMLADRSRRLLDHYRRGIVVDAATCPLQRALRLKAAPTAAATTTTTKP
jgi:hypothetical protein